VRDKNSLEKSCPFLFVEGRGDLAAHGMVAAGEVEEAGDLLHAQVPLRGHVRAAGGAVRQAREAVAAYQVSLYTHTKYTSRST